MPHYLRFQMSLLGLGLLNVLLSQPLLAGAVAPTRDVRSLVLLTTRHQAATDSGRVERQNIVVEANSSRPTGKQAAWFGSFAEEESTYDEDGDHGRVGDSSNPQIQFQNGWSPDIRSPAGQTNKVEAAFFHESRSGGPQAAWQTHSPAVTGGIAGHSSDTGEWYQRRAGNWAQEYNPDSKKMQGYQGNVIDRLTKPQTVNPAWFDASVGQVDGFGRKKMPGQMSGRRLVGWEERATNTTLTCSTPGCTANSTLYAFNWHEERAQRCKLSVFFHPTNFGHEGKAVDWITVNDKRISSRCVPSLESGCNAAKSRMLYPCVAEVPLDTIITSTSMGELRISAKISEGVDECPYEGNLLSAVPIVSCMVAPHNPSPMLGKMPTVPSQKELGSQLIASPTGQIAIYPLKCQTAGCVVVEPINVYRKKGVSFSSCTMKILINQTDFDSTFGNEVVEFLATDRQNITTNLKPGLNPCENAARGAPLPDDQWQNFVAAENVDVTDEVNEDALVVYAKISPAVDDCASQGNLLDGQVEVQCVAGPWTNPGAEAATAAL